MARHRLDTTTWQCLSGADYECFDRSYMGFHMYNSGMIFTGKSILFGQSCNFHTKGVSSLVERSRASRYSGRIAFALDTGGLPSNNDQEENFNSFTTGIGGTRLGRIVDAGARQLLQKLNAARKNFPMKVFLLLLGFYTANALATVLGQTGDWDVLVAGVVVAAIEGIGMLVYRKPPPVPSARLQSLAVMVNYWKAGVCLGLFVDAFKLGS